MVKRRESPRQGFRTILFLALAMLVVSAQAEAQFINPRFGYVPTSEWDRYNRAGMEAFRQDKFQEAEEHLLKARVEAEKYGSEDPRLATTINNLAQVYHARENTPTPNRCTANRWRSTRKP